MSKCGTGPTAAACIKESLHILRLTGDTVPYNVCRNFEWQLCAAQGKLPGQASGTIVFAEAPGSLDFGSLLPLGRHHTYSSNLVFYLEVCFYSRICANGHELFKLQVGQPWRCDLDEAAFWELSGVIVQP